MPLVKFEKYSDVPAEYAEEIEKVGIAMVQGKPPLGYRFHIGGKEFAVDGYAEPEEFLIAFGKALGTRRLLQLMLKDGPPPKGTIFARIVPVQEPALVS